MSDTPVWDQTVEGIAVDPDEPLEMWTAYLNLKFLNIDIIPIELMPARVTDRAVFIGGKRMPLIAQGGVTVVPGGGNDITRLVVEFLVDEVVVEGEPWVPGFVDLRKEIR